MNPSPRGTEKSFSGYVTTFSAIDGKSVSEVERSLGFNPGALRDGYLVYELLSPVELADFEWKDRTTYSGGWHLDRSINEYVQRGDELRSHFGKHTNYDEPATDALLQRVMENQRRRLNIRDGADRIIKVIPKGRISSFPDASLRNLPQWELKAGSPKKFRCIGDVDPGAFNR